MTRSHYIMQMHMHAHMHMNSFFRLLIWRVGSEAIDMKRLLSDLALLLHLAHVTLSLNKEASVTA